MGGKSEGDVLRSLIGVYGLITGIQLPWGREMTSRDASIDKQLDGGNVNKDREHTSQAQSADILIREFENKSLRIMIDCFDALER